MKPKINLFIRQLITLFRRRMTVIGLCLIFVGASLAAYAETISNPAMHIQPAKLTTQDQSGLDKPASSELPPSTTTLPSVEKAVESSTATPSARNSVNKTATITPKPSNPTPQPQPTMPVESPRISLTATTYNAPSSNRGIFFATINFRAGTYATLVRKLVGANPKETFSTANFSLNAPYGPDNKQESGSSLLPTDMLLGSSSGDEFEVVICENNGGTCGLKSNALRIVLHMSPGLEGNNSYLYEFRR